VHFDNEVHLGKMDKKVHLAKMDRPYVGIRKNHTDQIKMDKKVHLGEMDFFVHFFKVGLFAPALDIKIVNRHYFYAHRSHPQIPSTSFGRDFKTDKKFWRGVDVPQPIR
jgi:hypothetical protein